MKLNEISNTPVSDNMAFEAVSRLIEDMLSIEPDAQLDEEVMKNAKIFGVLSRLQAVHARKLGLLYRQRLAVEAARERHYGGKMLAEHYRNDPLPEPVNKTDIPKKLSADKQVQEIRELHDEQDRIVGLIEKGFEKLRQRTWDIKSIIEYRRMILGV